MTLRQPRRPALGLAALLCLVTLSAPVAARSRVPRDAELDLHRRLPGDPLIVGAARIDDARATLAAAAEWSSRFLDESRRGELASWLDAIEGVIGIDVERELLPLLGPQLAVGVDFPPIDEILALVNRPEGGTADRILGRSGLLATVRDRTALERLLATVVERTGVVTSVVDGTTRVEIPLGESSVGEPLVLALYHAVRGDLLAVGFDPGWVTTVLDADAPRRGVATSTDFAHVFEQLDRHPTSLTYINLPRAREWIGGSIVVQAILGSDDDLRSLAVALLDPAMTPVGVGWTTVARGGGVRTSRFGPTWSAGLAVTGGLLAALILEGDGADDSGREREAILSTLDAISTIATACEGFSSDLDAYPGPTDGWVPVERIAVYLEPVYASPLPKRDAWENPILYWSDGASYRIVSLGLDGRPDREWDSVKEPNPGRTPGSDILFADGRFLVLPPQVVNE